MENYIKHAWTSIVFISILIFWVYNKQYNENKDDHDCDPT